MPTVTLHLFSASDAAHPFSSRLFPLGEVPRLGDVVVLKESERHFTDAPTAEVTGVRHYLDLTGVEVVLSTTATDTELAGLTVFQTWEVHRDAVPMP